jgi:peptidoglycan/LPS O-acetylase OafA/YrhL
MAGTELALPPSAASRSGIDFRTRMPALDGLRGVAILSVFLYHYASGGAQHPTGIVLKSMYTLTGFGWVGVDIFFVLSGFLITGILYDTRNDAGYFGKFYARRTLRIFPIYYLFLAAMAVAGLAMGVRWRLGQASFLFYVGFPCAIAWPQIIPTNPFLRVTHLWSLCVEEQFYLLWPLAIRVLRTRGRILAACAVVMVLALALRTAVWASGTLSPAWAYASLPCRMDSLAVGAALAVLLRSPGGLHVKKAAPFVLPSAVAGLAAVLLLSRSVSHDAPGIFTLGYTLIAIAAGSVLVLAATGVGAIPAMLRWPGLRLLGKYSYGFYLYHFPLAEILDPAKPPLTRLLHSEVAAKLIFVVVSFFLNLGVAAASFHWIEAPIMRLKSRFKYA